MTLAAGCASGEQRRYTGAEEAAGEKERLQNVCDGTEQKERSEVA